MKHRFLVLDVFRGLFAMSVVLFHLSPRLKSPLVINPLISHADRFVDFFFVLSGFVIAYAYSDRLGNWEQLKKFAKSRFLRLYPLHLALLMIYAIYIVSRQVGSFTMDAVTLELYSAKSFVITLFLLNSIHWSGLERLGWNMPTWSISAELISYLLFGCLILTVKRWGLLLRLSLYLTLVFLAKLSIVYLNPTPALTATWDNGFLRGICGFFSGATTWHLFQLIHAKAAKLSQITFSVLEICSCLLVLGMVSYAPFFSQFWFSYEILFSIVIVVFGFERGILSRLLHSSTSLTTLGKISYSVYMTHNLVQIAFSIAFKRFTFRSPFIDNLYVIGVLVTVTLLSMWTYKYIEMRFRHGINRFSLL